MSFPSSSYRRTLLRHHLIKRHTGYNSHVGTWLTLMFSFPLCLYSHTILIKQDLKKTTKIHVYALKCRFTWVRLHLFSPPPPPPPSTHSQIYIHASKRLSIQDGINAVVKTSGCTTSRLTPTSGQICLASDQVMSGGCWTYCRSSRRLLWSRDTPGLTSDTPPPTTVGLGVPGFDLRL